MKNQFVDDDASQAQTQAQAQQIGLDAGTTQRPGSKGFLFLAFALMPAFV